MASKINRIANIIGSIEYAVTVPLFLIMLTLMFVQVVFRYFLESPLPWSEELIRYLFIATAFLGGAIATMEREHIEINFIQTVFARWADNPQKHNRIVKISNVLRDTLAIVFLSIITYLTWFLVADQLRYSMVSPAAQVPMWIVTGFMLLGLALMVLHSILNIILNLNGYGRTGYEAEEEEEGGDLTCF